MNSLARHIVEYRLDFLLFLCLLAAVYAGVVLHLRRNGRLHATIWWCGVLLVLLIPVGWWWTERCAEQTQRVLINQVQGLAPTYALELAKLGHSDIRLETPADNPTYLALIEAQKNWLRVNPTISDIYTFRRTDDGRLQYIVDSETDYDNDGAFIGLRESRTGIGEFWKSGFNRVPIDAALAGTAMTFDKQFYTDRWGTWVSAYAPIHDASGSVEALVGVDFPVQSWLSAIQTSRLSVIARVAAIAALLLGGSAVIAMLRSSLTVERLVQKQLTEAMEVAERSAAEAREAEAFKAQFLANMSHEIRTPMNGIIGMGELLMQTDLDKEQRQFQSLALDSARSLLELLNDILDFSRIEAGKLELESVGFPIHQLLAQAMHAMAQRASDRQLEMILHVGQQVPERLVGDPTRLRQVVLNLISNAIKFTEQGEIELSVEWTGKDDDGSSRFHFAVRDTGIGISEDNRTKIFESFRQAETSTARQYGGTGLGLSICSRLVDLMGGELQLESEVGQGSTFSFTIPMGRAAPESSKTIEVDLEGRTALVVDDNATNRVLFDEVVRSTGMDCETAADGEQALAKLMARADAGEPFDLLVMDTTLPRLSGHEVTRKMAASPRLRSTTVILLTSFDSTRVQDELTLSIVKHVHLKPVARTTLLNSIADVFAEGSLETTLAGDTLELESTIETTRPIKRVLLAEDNPVNQTVAINLLQNRGHEVELAVNGAIALECFLSREFDVILMDVQMPVMDGLEATRRIRQQERGCEHPIPIFAMTAQAMEGDEQRCLQAGMDGYLSKPVDREELFRMVEQCDVIAIQRRLPETDIDTGGRVRSGSLLADQTEVPADAPRKDSGAGTTELLEAFDTDGFARNTGGSTEVALQLIQLFEEESKRQLKDVQSAVETGDADSLQRAAHTIKGSIGIFAAHDCFEAASTLEQAAAAGELREVETQFMTLSNEVRRLLAILRPPPLAPKSTLPRNNRVRQRYRSSL
ncbi:MAG: response regulator [Planctomycetota bacterium]